MTTSQQSFPFWATPAGVAAVTVGYCFVFIVLGGVLASGLPVDDSAENYLLQTLSVTYSPRNPPLFDWLMFGLQQIFGVGLTGFVIARYSLLFAAAMLVYAIARRCIRDPRLQALAVFSLSLFWVIGYHTNRNFNHSNVMIVAIAGSFLTLMDLRRQPSPWRYALLGLWIAIGVLGKFGFLAYLAVALAGALYLREFRPVILSARFLITIIVALTPIGAFLIAAYAENANFMTGVQGVVGRNASALGLLNNLFIYLAGLAGYLLPFAAVVALCFGVRKLPSMERLRDPSAVQLLAIIICAGVLLSLLGALPGALNVRDRYFHVWCFLASVLVFALLDGTDVRTTQIRNYTMATTATFVIVALLFLAQRLMPATWLCRDCTQSTPFARLGQALATRYGTAPTLIANGFNVAGQLRLGTPGARLLVEDARRPRPDIARPAGPCLMTWSTDPGAEPLSTEFKSLAAAAGASLDRPDIVEVSWWAPLLPGGRTSKWAVVKLSDDSPICR